MTPLFRPPARVALLAFGAALVLAALGLGPTVGLAQDPQMRSLIDRVDRLQRELNTLQRQVFRGEPPPAAAAGAGGDAGVSPSAAALIEKRLSQFEAELRTLTGQIEESTFRYHQVSERLDRLAADLEARLQRLEQGAGLAAAEPGQGMPGQGMAAMAPGAGAGASPPQQAAGSGPRVLGTINPADLQSLQSRAPAPAASAAQATESQPRSEQAALAPGGAGAAAGGPEEQYKHAFTLLSQANYAEAEQALRSFLEQHPTSPLAGNAKYWLGESYYARGDYQQAAVTFAEAYQEHPDNAKAPDNLLKLGMALGALGSNADACGTFAELLKRYPDASATVLQRARQEQQRLSCS